jgi:ribosomal protein S18 acetylase RimI-like enzyme
MLQIKNFPKERWHEFKALRLEALQKDPLAFGSSYEEEINFTSEKWKSRIDNALFAVFDDKPVGMVVFLINSKQKLNHVAEIFGVFVKEEYRTKKIGKQLVESAINNIRRKENIIKIKLVVTAIQDSAVKLYSSLGFEIVGTLKNELCFESKFYDALVMEKLL